MESSVEHANKFECYNKELVLGHISLQYKPLLRSALPKEKNPPQIINCA